MLLLCILSTDSAPAYKIFEECDATNNKNGINNFTICGFKADSNVNLDSVDEVYSRYTAVSVQNNDSEFKNFKPSTSHL
jgi:hypothetical protein